ncbi:uncharacterized protein Gasu_65470 [Galdieria sulphuraria]|uniref:Uncharacterized protein n=1 Tax=Galdieria sulphuraria TaxID=130081 RepID=M2XQB7_GALSU|nr:uncharacterized protein Gasu_65470 [Galdieria sulphuraria]EME25793.1 hypothetical protein Gasu_65470 [Galdieria sulphuraria]|eukprot:XP_005702313.1 hypothetical protein Gasu_65470 [Galdieria sulphuraria]
MDLLEEFTQVDLADEVPTSTSILSSKYTEDNLVDSLLDKNHNGRKSPHSLPDSCKLLSNSKQIVDRKSFESIVSTIDPMLNHIVYNTHFLVIFSANGKDGQFGKRGRFGMGPRNFDLKIAIMGVGWERMGKLEMGESGELRWVENGWGKGVRKLKRGQPKGDRVDLEIAIMDAGKNGTECKLKILGESVQEGCLKNSNSKSKRLKFELQLHFMR